MSEALRAGLVALAERYLAALRTGDPADLPLAARFRSTEDTQELPLGTGIWRTIKDLREGGHWFVEPDAGPAAGPETGPETGQAEFWGLMDENGHPAILSVRLAMHNGQFIEAETIVTRKGAFFDPAMVLREDPGFHRVLDFAERGSRETLIAAANLYFDGIELSDGSRIPVAERCRRLVNGVVDSLDAEANLIPGEEHRALPVARQIDLGHYAYIEALRGRRFPIVDLERGLVVCHVIFDHPGHLLRAGQDLPIRSPNSMVFTEVFKVVGGTIEAIWALGTAPLPYGIGSGW